MPWSREGHVIPTRCQWSRDPDIEPSFASNRTPNRYESTLSLPPSSLSYRLGYNLLSYQLGHNLPYISTSSFWKRSPTCLTEPRPSSLLDAGSREKTTYRSAPFPSGGGGARDALQRKATGGATSEVVRETAGWTRPDLTLGTSTSASTRPPLCGGGPPSLCDGGPSSLCSEDGRKSRRNSR